MFLMTLILACTVKGVTSILVVKEVLSQVFVQSAVGQLVSVYHTS